jgi:hypothetical protein
MVMIVPLQFKTMYVDAMHRIYCFVTNMVAFLIGQISSNDGLQSAYRRLTLERMKVEEEKMQVCHIKERESVCVKCQ